MKKMQAFVVALALTWSQVFVLGDPEAEANSIRDDLNGNNREIVPLDQIQGNPWMTTGSYPQGNYPQYATNNGPYQPSYYGGYPQRTQMYQPQMISPQYSQQEYQPQPQNYQQQFYRPQPLPYAMPQQYQQQSWQPMAPESYVSSSPTAGFEMYGGQVAQLPQEMMPQGEPLMVESNIPQGIPPNPVETPVSSQIWGPQPSPWGTSNGIPTWKRSYTPLPGQSGCYNRCRPSCGPNACQPSCQSACNIRPTCGRRGQTMYSGSTMICGRQGLNNQAGLWPEVKRYQDYQNPPTWGQSYQQSGMVSNGLGQVTTSNKVGVETL